MFSLLLLSLFLQPLFLYHYNLSRQTRYREASETDEHCSVQKGCFGFLPHCGHVRQRRIYIFRKTVLEITTDVSCSEPMVLKWAREGGSACMCVYVCECLCERGRGSWRWRGSGRNDKSNTWRGRNKEQDTRRERERESNVPRLQLQDRPPERDISLSVFLHIDPPSNPTNNTGRGLLSLSLFLKESERETKS